jgi:hypothetical protein
MATPRKYVLVFSFYILSVCAFCAGAPAGEGYGVFYIKGDESAKPAAQKNIPVLPSPVDIDDGEVINRSGPHIYRHRVCAEGQYLSIYDYTDYSKIKPGDNNAKILRQLEGRRAVKCNYYYGPDTPAAKQAFIAAALKEFDFYNIYSASVTETKPYRDIAVLKFPLDKMEAGRAFNFNEVDGIIYKTVLTDKIKIKKLYNYAYAQLALEMDKIMKETAISALPQRISVYEDYTPGGPARALAVLSFADKKFTVELGDLNRSGLIYDIRPDYTVKYSPFASAQ